MQCSFAASVTCVSTGGGLGSRLWLYCRTHHSSIGWVFLRQRIGNPALHPKYCLLLCASVLAQRLYGISFKCQLVEPTHCNLNCWCAWPLPPLGLRSAHIFCLVIPAFAGRTKESCVHAAASEAGRKSVDHRTEASAVGWLRSGAS